jgi:glycine hydroxymethyltransferase
MTCNKNGVPYDDKPFTITSGVRLGTPAATTRGFDVSEFTSVVHWIADVIDSMQRNDNQPDKVVQKRVRANVLELTKKFPIYPL